MKYYFISLLFLLFTPLTFAHPTYPVFCTDICELEYSKIKLCVRFEKKLNENFTEHVNVYYSTPEGSHIEIQAYPYTSKDTVLKNYLKTSLENRPERLHHSLKEEVQNVKCERKNEYLDFFNVPMEIHFFQ